MQNDAALALDGTDPLAHAIAYAQLGWRVIPILPGQKRPSLERWQDVATTDPELIQQWWSSWPEHGCGLATGSGSGIFALDVDPAHGGDDTLADLEARHGRLPETVEAVTGGGGRHLLFWMPTLQPGQRLGNSAGRLGPGLDIRAEGGQIVVAPTLHPTSGRRYQWEVSSRPGEVEVAEAPDWLLKLLLEDHTPLPEGQLATRHYDTTFAWDHTNALGDAGALDLLARHGWHSPRQDRSGTWFLTRPGKDARAGTGCCVGRIAPGVTRVFTSEAPPLEAERSYSVAELYAALEHHGDRKAADAALCRLTGLAPSYAIDPAELAAWVEGEHRRAVALGFVSADAPGEGLPSALPLEFWQSRPALAHIRQAAHARQRSADAVLHVVLARIAAAVPHTLQLPATVGSPAPLCFFTVILAPPGVGKGNANAIGAELLPLPAGVSQVPLGSGEGLVELLFEWVTEEGEGGKKVKRKIQTKRQAFVYVDEGQALAELGRRSGSTLMPTLRSIWSGGMIGNANAAQETKRVVPAGQYTYGVVVGLQDSKAGPLLDDADGGTPQRFGWASATAPDLPDTPPRWPGALPWAPPGPVDLEHLKLMQGGQVRHEMAVAPEIRREILAADLARQRGQVVIAEMAAHSDLLRLKVAALLALLDHRLEVTAADWQLAYIVKATSDAVRDRAAAVVRADAQRQESSNVSKMANRAAESDAAVRRRRVVDGARAIARKVVAEPERWTVSDLRRAMKNWRAEYDDALVHALAEGWVLERTEPGQGTERRALHPGPSTPA